MSKSKVALQLRISETTHKKVKIISGKKLRSINSQFEYFILKGVEEYEKHHGKINLNDK